MKKLIYRTIRDLMGNVSTRPFVPRLFRSRALRPAVMVVLGLLIVAALSSAAQAREFIVVIANVNNAQHPTAQIDISIDIDAGTGLPCQFDVYNVSDGAHISQFVVYTNANGFCSSASAAAPNDNFFAVSGGLPVVVRVFTPDNTPMSTAVVRQDLQGSKIVFGMPATRRFTECITPLAASTHMAIAVGNLEQGTSLLIANASAQPVEVSVFAGGEGAGDRLRYTNPKIPVLGAWQVNLQPAEANSHLIVRSTGDVTVQLVVNQGRNHISVTALVAP